MADKPTTEAEASKDSAEGAPETAAAPKAQGLKPLLISSAIMAVVLGGIGFALAYFVLPGRLQSASAAATPASTPTSTNAASATPAAPIPPSASTAEKTARTPEEMAAAGGKAVTKFTIEEVTVNIADTRGNRFVRAGVDFEAPPAVLEEARCFRPRRSTNSLPPTSAATCARNCSASSIRP
jgi:flagellar basal body-associated protein FliL